MPPPDDLEPSQGAGMGKGWVRSRLRTLQDPAAAIAGDEGAALITHRLGDRATPAAVLVGLIDRPDGPTVLLTERTQHLKDHAGQVSFPGGRIEGSDPSPAAAALREAEEEVGLAPERVDVLGHLATYQTVTGFLIRPVVGWLEPPLVFTPDPVEVADVFEVPLAFVLDPGNHRRQSYRRGPHTRSYYVLPYQGRFIWGATAGMLVNLARILRG